MREIRQSGSEGGVALTPPSLPLSPLANRSDDRVEKYLDEIQRRARQGKCFHRPGLGVREFAADFDWVDSDPDVALARRAAELGHLPNQFNEDLGLMLYDVFDARERAHGFRWLRTEEIDACERDLDTALVSLKNGEQTKRRKEDSANRRRWTGKLIKPQPAFFHARIENSKLDCHPDRVQILTPTIGGH